MDRHFWNAMHDKLIWLPELGMGYCGQTREGIYSKAYHDNYVKLGQTVMGKALNKFRAEFVNRFWTGPVLDFGAGAGDFVRERTATWGYDVSPTSVLELGPRFRVPNNNEGAITFWDSLEHVPDPGAAVQNASNWVFISMPVYESGEAVSKSKHFKPGEHMWYWTKHGLIGWMWQHGFILHVVCDEETRLGREGIWTFAFERVK